MFQAATFNPSLNDKELGMAERIGMNTMRFFLQDQLWTQDKEGFQKRLNAFLAIWAKHHIRPILVLFDICWDTNPYPGPQHPPLPRAFAWAREMQPTQPLTSGVWHGDWSDPAKETETTHIQLANSDVISFHDYDWPEGFQARIDCLRPTHRTLLCTEYIARGNGSTFDTILPIANREHVAAINWGLVAGKTQTYLPWDSWDRPYTRTQPAIWFHEVFRQDDTSYRQHEVDLIRQFTGRGTPGAAPAQE